MIGSYAFAAQAANPDIRVIMPQDYTLVMSRIALIPKAAAHPNAARLFLDFLLSRNGQAQLAAKYLTPVRSDVPVPAILSTANVPTRAIRVGPGLMVNQDQLTHKHFLRRWETFMRPGDKGKVRER
jgi:iron(III) transport system substrate-binding protein